MLVSIAHPSDQVVCALISYTSHVFTIALLELVASASHEFFMQATCNKSKYEPACL